MNIPAYIESGILELYVLDLLSDTERQEVEDSALQHTEIRQEIRTIEDAMRVYAQSGAISPPAGLKANILKRASERLPASGQPKTDAQPIPGGAGIWRVLTFVGFLGAMLGLLYAFSTMRDRDTISEDLTNSRNEFATLKASCDDTRSENERLLNQLNIVRNADTKAIRMEGTDNAPDAIATIYYDANARKTYLDINNLPAPPADRQYQLWAIVGGTPVDMGVFNLTDQFKEVDFIEAPQAFAVTLETMGGNPTPNLEALTVIKNVEG